MAIMPQGGIPFAMHGRTMVATKDYMHMDEKYGQPVRAKAISNNAREKREKGGSNCLNWSCIWSIWNNKQLMKLLATICKRLRQQHERRHRHNSNSNGNDNNNNNNKEAKLSMMLHVVALWQTDWRTNEQTIIWTYD